MLVTLLVLISLSNALLSVFDEDARHTRGNNGRFAKSEIARKSKINTGQREGDRERHTKRGSSHCDKELVARPHGPRNIIILIMRRIRSAPWEFQKDNLNGAIPSGGDGRGIASLINIRGPTPRTIKDTKYVVSADILGFEK